MGRLRFRSRSRQPTLLTFAKMKIFLLLIPHMHFLWQENIHRSSAFSYLLLSLRIPPPTTYISTEMYGSLTQDHTTNTPFKCQQTPFTLPLLLPFPFLTSQNVLLLLPVAAGRLSHSTRSPNYGNGLLSPLLQYQHHHHHHHHHSNKSEHRPE